MYDDTLEHFAGAAARKAAAVRARPLSFFVAATMAGAYVGLGIVLIFSIGALLDPAWQRLAMGASFGIALTLVIFAGSELFTGLTMIMPVGLLRGRVAARDVGASWALSWTGNLAGALLLAALFVAGGGGALLADGAPLLRRAAAAKIEAPAAELLARAVLCNWLVCLAIWMSARTTSDAARLGLIFWCLLAFVASGYEHSVANMTLFSIAWLGLPDGVPLAGVARNLLWVTIGNAVAGALFMAGGYAFAARPFAAPVPHAATGPATNPVARSG